MAALRDFDLARIVHPLMKYSYDLDFLRIDKPVEGC